MQPLRYRHPCYRLLLAVSAAALCAVSWSGPARAQVVIEERVEIAPGVVEQEATAMRWPGGVRGRGTLTVIFTGAKTYAYPVGALTLTLTTTRGGVPAQTVTVPASTGTALLDQQTVCASWEEYDAECEEYNYVRAGDGIVATFELEHDEAPDSLFLQGPGVNVRRSYYVSSTTGTGTASLEFNCQYQTVIWGGPGVCACLDGRTGEAHGKYRLRWTFEADPADMLVVTPSKNLLTFSPGSSNPSRAQLDVQAAYADGIPAPLEDRTPLVFSSSTRYGALKEYYCSFGCSDLEYGASVTAKYKHTRVDFRADGWGDPAAVGPLCDTDVTVNVNGEGLSGETTLTILGTGPPPSSDTLVVWASPSSLAAGDSAGVFVQHSRAGCGGDELPDSTRMAVAAMPGLYGELSYAGERSPIFTNVPYGELKSGEVKLIADGDVPCEDDTMTVLVEGGGMRGYAEVVIEGVNGQQRGTESSCVSIDWPDFTETKESIIDWHDQNCSAQIAASPPPTNTLDSFAEHSYERDLARHLFGGMGWGSISGYNRPLDGYLRWYTDELGNPTNFVSTIFESKLKDKPPISNYPGDTTQALAHINFLGDQYDAWLGSSSAPVGAVGGPILIYSSQNTWDDLGNGEDWWLGYHPHVNNRVITEANERGVLLLHVKVVHMPGTSYRYLKVKFMNEFSLLDTNIPGLSWLLRRASTFDLSRWSFHTFLPFGYDCDEVGGQPGDDEESPPPPF